MPTFRFIARSSTGEEVAGSLEAHTAIDAMNQLRRRGLRVERLQDEEETSLPSDEFSDSWRRSESPTVGSEVRLVDRSPDNDAGQQPGAPSADASPPETVDVSLGVEELAEIAGRIAGITKAQLPLTPGLRAMSEGLPSRSLRRGLRALCDRLERGEPLEEALQAGKGSLPGHLSGLIVIGVRSGRLGEIMDWFLNHVRRQTDLRRRCRASLMYPVLLLTAGISAAIFGLLLVVPGVRQVYGDLGVDLPALTAALLTTSDFVRHYGLVLLAGVLLLLGGVPLLLWSLGGKPLLDRTLAATPFVGTMFRCSALAGFCELMSMFVSARLPLSQAVRLAGEGCHDADLQGQFADIAQCLEQGQDDTELFRRLANISPQLIHVFHGKSREANFNEALLAAVRIYENQARMQITLAGMFLEPLVIVGVLGGVGTFALSLFLPLIKVLNSLS
jgi:general secretion pathway protein F